MNFNDPELASQLWYLGPSGANLLSVYDQYSGRGIRIGVVDTGINTSDPDFTGRLGSGGWNALTHTSDYNNTGGDQHGTWVAGYIGAAANNAIGGIGTAWGATLIGFKMATRSERTAAQELELLQRQYSVDISHNSWSYSGESFRDNFLGAYAAQGTAIADAASRGRGGLGTIIIRSAGNNGDTGEQMTTHNYQNNRFTMAVGATNVDGTVASFSDKGAALWVVAPAEATSFAATVLTGTVALMLEANPNLGYRDVQAVIALSARYTDAGASWFTNHADGFANGGGLRSSNATGFGMIDAHAAVRLAESWSTAAKTEANILHLQANGSGFTTPDIGTASGKATIGQNIVVERVDLTIDLLHPHVGDLVISLVSPSGTESVLLDRLQKGSFAGTGALTFTLASSQFLWEASPGDWVLKVTDAVSGSTAQVKGWTLDLYGAPQTTDDVYFLTDRFEGLAQTEAGRHVLADRDGGNNTLNAAAVTTDLMLDLHPGAAGLVAGQAFSLAAGTVITTALGGDGNDRLIASDTAATLRGGRGRDTLTGGAGADTLEGGIGDDWLQGNGGSDTAVFNAVKDRFAWVVQADGSISITDKGGVFGTDTLWNIQKLAFSDAVVDAPGGDTTPTQPPPANAASIDIGSGAGSVVLKISQDYYLAAAQYRVLLDGAQLGGTLTAIALHGTAQDTVTVHGDFATGSHSIAVQFLNDAWGGTASTDRNLYFEAASYNGTALLPDDTTLMSNNDTGRVSFSAASSGTPPPSSGINIDIGSGAGSVVLKISQDYYLAAAQYRVLLDGAQLGGTLTATALHGTAQDSVTVHGDFATGSHSIAVQFLNDAWGGAAGTDRNLYFEAASYNGTSLLPDDPTLMSSNDTGRVSFSVTGSGTPPPSNASIDIGNGGDAVILKISQDYYLDNAQYRVLLDGTQLGGILTATARHGQASDTVTIHGDFSAGSHSVTVEFLNDAWGGTPGTDRNLYIDGASHAGTALPPDDASLMSSYDAAHITFVATIGAAVFAI